LLLKARLADIFVAAFTRHRELLGHRHHSAVSGAYPGRLVRVAVVDRRREAAALLLQRCELVAYLQSRVAALAQLRDRGSATPARRDRALRLPHPGLQRRQLRVAR